MTITAEQKDSINKILEVFETGRIGDNYDTIALLPDGPNKRVQITFGKHQTTEYGQLPNLLTQYVRRGGLLADYIKPYLHTMGQRGKSSFANDKTLLKHLRNTANDPIMRELQDSFFEKEYFEPALLWATQQGFTLPLSMLVIYDSYIHSGQIRDDIRKAFPERPPVRGGDEKTWIAQYLQARENWLSKHSNRVVRNTVYRTNEMQEFIAEDNWNLERPLNVRGIIIK